MLSNIPNNSKILHFVNHLKTDVYCLFSDVWLGIFHDLSIYINLLYNDLQ